LAKGLCAEVPIPADALVGLREILPCFSALSNGEWAYQCALKFIDESGREGLVYLDPIGKFVEGKKADEPQRVRAEIDVIHVDIPLRQATLSATAPLPIDPLYGKEHADAEPEHIIS
jgi:hypothetical protein